MSGRAVDEVGPEAHAARLRLGLEPAKAGLHQPGELRVAQLERERARVDARELEQVVDEPAERPHLLLEGAEVVLRLGEAVLDRLEHRLHVRERRAQVVARPGDELRPGVEQLLEPRGHLVERGRQRRELALPRRGHAGRQIAARELGRGASQRREAPGDRARQAESGDDGGGRRRGRDGEDREVVLRLEHDDAAEHDRRERQQHGEEREAGELEAECRQPAQRRGGEEPGRQRRRGDEERERDHPANR